MPSFVDRMLKKYRPTDRAENVVNEFRKFYKRSAERAAAEGKRRKITYLGNVQSNLSTYKSRVPAPEEFKAQLHLTKEEMAKVAADRKLSVRNKSIGIATVDGDQFVRDCQELLQHPKIALRIIALACLTGRRMSEIVSTLTLEPPRQPHETNLNYWACAGGLLKQREDVRCIDIPLFAPRVKITAALASLRKAIGTVAPEDANRLFAKPIARAMKKYCPEIGNIHTFRKFYAIMCFEYFNANSCSLPRLAADYLGHKDISESIITYLNFRVTTAKSLRFK